MQIFHGEDQIKSRSAFLTAKVDQKQKGRQIQNFDGGQMSHQDLLLATSSMSLLGDTSAIFIENIYSRRPSNEKKAILELLSKTDFEDIYIWEIKDVSTQLKEVPVTKQRKFDLPKVIFQFVDTLSPSLYREAIVSSAPEQIVGLLAKRLQDLILLKQGQSYLPDWQKGKLLQQANKYSLEKLEELNNSLLKIDYQSKTSQSPLDLVESLESWVIEI